MLIIGLMSGTSLDGISAALVRFSREGARIVPDLLGFEVLPYSSLQRERLTHALEAGTPDEYCRLNFDLGEWLAAAALRLLASSGVARGEVSAIASHGQTLWHVPGHSTWQTGESAVIAERTGIPVISDFRVRDVAAGGQGAPLVSIADRLLFSDATTWRALQNLGGIGNVTVVPPGGDERGVRAFDTGPGVVIVDGVVRRCFPELRYDEDGRLARQGQVIHDVVDDLLDDPYFLAPPPKSTGREFFNAAYIDAFVDRCRAAHPGSTPADLVATAVALTAASIRDAYRRFMPEPIAEVVVSGGGARNPALVAAIASAIAPTRLRTFDDVFFDGEAKEAVAFALLGYLHRLGEPGNVPGATGARGPRVLGKLTPA